ncbi:MAG: 23S rRNA (pseudouridine(1915)-N(3))-methyltransferase RlmH [Candidatus Aminicenantes bacterium]|nr:23S rRNA (pseudouridine(1915)-N(3))-methyltransferase RlmH [Candidatus Aminicenantes bacterium]
MNKIGLICVGELKFKELKELEKKYLQKIGRFMKLQPVILKDLNIRDEAAKKKKEGQMMLEQLDKGDFVIALDEKGKKLDSIAFSRFLSDKLSYFPGRIIFLIGGFAGLAGLLDSRINLKLSFSEMTFAHDIFRVLFLEQLYRAFTIMKGIKYHR